MESDPPENTNEILSEQRQTTPWPEFPSPPLPLDDEAYNTVYLGPPTLLTAFRGELYNMLFLGYPKASPISRKRPYNTLTHGDLKSLRAFRENPPSNTPSGFRGEPYNTLTLGPLDRGDLLTVLTCEASNNNLTQPTTDVVTIDMHLPPLSVEIIPPSEEALRSEREYVVECVVVGARPLPALTWWSGHQRVLDASVTQTSKDKNVTTSRVSFTPKPEDHGSYLRCIAESHAPPSTLEDTWPLTVYCRYHLLPSTVGLIS
ncbi:Nephrin-like 19, partial [Homarus americanus]